MTARRPPDGATHPCADCEPAAGDFRSQHVPYLIVLAGPRVGAIFRLDADSVLGRDGSATIPLADEAISRRHAQIAITDNRVSVADLGSTNGTFVNGARITADCILTPSSFSLRT